MIFLFCITSDYSFILHPINLNSKLKSPKNVTEAKVSNLIKHLKFEKNNSKLIRVIESNLIYIITSEGLYT